MVSFSILGALFGECVCTGAFDCSSPFDPAGIVVWFFVMLYMFKALGVVCDEYFVPSLEMISEALQLSSDVAGATFMAAGSSAPELFTSLVATFLIVNEGGVGTIIGSAIFNILVIIGVTCACAGQELVIWWYPLCRDCCFYLLSIVELYLFLMDEVVDWYEALIMFLSYVAYCIYMKFNDKISSRLGVSAETEVEKFDPADVETPKGAAVENGCASSDPKAKELALKEASLPTVQQSGNPNSVDYDDVKKHAHHPDKVAHTADGHMCAAAPVAAPRSSRRSLTQMRHEALHLHAEKDHKGSPEPGKECSGKSDGSAAEKATEADDDDRPTGWRRFARDPLLVLLEVVMPSPEKYWLLFSLSILWIAICTYLMVDAVNRIGCNLDISPLFMGLVFLSAGTSVPDALGSIAVAKQGEGDMAVANAFGSNVFDILLGLGVPWLLKAAMGETVSFAGAAADLAIWMIILAAILVLFLLALIVNKWKLNKCMGVTLMSLYIVYVGVCLLRAFLI